MPSSATAEAGRRWLTASLAAQAALIAYFFLIVTFPLGHWNDQPCCPPVLTQLSTGTATGSAALPLLLFAMPLVGFAVGFWKRWRWLEAISSMSYVVWFGLQVMTWWPPYIFGASAQWQQVYARAFSRSTKWLPSSGNHLAPDAEHLVLQILLIAVLVFTAIGLKKVFTVQQSAAATAR